MYWACAQLDTRRERLALHCLALAGFTTYLPRLGVRRVNAARKVPPPLFPGYCFVAIELQWHAASKSPGVRRLVLDGAHPAKVPDAVINDLKKRERNGLIELPPPPGFRRGDRVRVRGGALTGHFGLYEGQRGADRIAVLLRWLGSERTVVLPKGDVVSTN